MKIVKILKIVGKSKIILENKMKKVSKSKEKSAQEKLEEIAREEERY